MERITLTVEGMSCSHCVAAVEKSVGALPGVQQVKVNLGQGLVQVVYDSKVLSVEEIKKSIDNQGYEVLE